MTITLSGGALAASTQSDAVQPLPKGMRFVTSVEGISEYRLPNGLTVLLFPDPSKQTITVNITYLVGSRHENYGETGMAHLLEHLLFKGTPKHPNIYQELSRRGARPNGTTWYDRTNYYETFSATDDNLAWTLRMEADRMINSFIAEKDLKSEMTVVRNEFESGENRPFSVLLKRLAGASYDWHGYGKPTIGNRSDIENVRIENLQAFYRKYYQPDNAVLMIAGKIDPKQTLDLVSKHFSPIPKPKRVIEPQYTAEPTQDGERVVTIRRAGDIQIVAASYHVSSVQHPDRAPLSVLSIILGDTPTGRLHKALAQTGKATSVGTYDPGTYDPGVFMAYAALRNQDSLDTARDELLRVVETAGAEPPTEEEVRRAKVKIASEFDLFTSNAEELGVALSEAIAAGDWRLFFWGRDQVAAVTPAEVQRVASLYLKRDNRTLAQFIPTDKPERADIPPRPNIAALLKDYKGSATISAGEAFEPTQENIDRRTLRSSLPVGMKLALLPKKTRGGVVQVKLQLHFGDEQSLRGQQEIASLVGSMLLRGSHMLNRQQISDELDRLKAEVDIGGGADSAYASFRTVRENLPQVLRIVAESLRQPSFPIDEFDSIKREMQARVESQRSEPQSVGMNELQRLFNVYPKDDPRYTKSFDEQLTAISKVTREDVKRFHAEFYGASASELAVVGDFDPKALESTIGELFGDWKSPRKFERLVKSYSDIPPTEKVLSTPDKPNAFFVTRQNIKLRDDDSDYPALELGNYMLGGGFLNSRLSTRIRQKDGLSYSVGSQFSANSLDPVSIFFGYAIFAPENVDKLQTAFKEELTRALKEGFTAEEVAAAKQGLLDSRRVNRAQDEILASAWASNLYVGRTFQWSADLEKKIAALTPEQIRDAMRRHLDPAKLTVVKAGDFAKTGK
ncbi:MAG TPA: pitrilysin family protein [Burkholderiales bacterium]|nr:pitrilysin family protein [Burkholderiales bacterium]